MAKLTSDASDQQDEHGPNGQRWPNGGQAGAQANGNGQPLVFGFPSANLFMGAHAPSMQPIEQQDSSSDMIQPFATTTFISAPQSFNQLVNMRQVPSSSTLTTPLTSNGSPLQMHHPPMPLRLVNSGNGSGAVINLLGQVIGGDMAENDIEMGSSSPPRAVHSSVSHNFGSSTTQGEIRQNNTVSSLSSNNPSGRSELFNFFAAMQEPSRPSSVFAISRSQTPGSPAERPAQTEATSSAGRSIQSPLVINNSPGCLSIFAASSRGPAAAKVLKRPRDLLLHMIRGRTVFETSNGQMFTPEHIAYINAYYAGDKQAADLKEILAEPSSPDSVPGQEDPSRTQTCQLCRTCDPSVLPGRDSKLCTQCLNADLELPVSPTRPVPLSKQAPSPGPKAGRKGVLDAAPARTNHRPVIGDLERPAIAPEKLFGSAIRPNHDLSPSPQRIPLRKVVEPSLAVTKPARLTSAGSLPSTSATSEEPSTLFEPNMTGFSNFRGHAFLTVLLKKKPDIGQWLVSDVGIFLRSLRGMDNFAQKFVDGEVDGHALCLLDADNMVKDMGMSKCLAYKILLMVRRLKDNSSKLEDNLHLL